MTRPITDADMSKRAAEMEPWYWRGLPPVYKCPSMLVFKIPSSLGLP